MKTPSTELHRLIHSLDKSEKAWFTTQAEKGSDYQRLFDAILRQKIYDEKAIKEQFKGEPFLNRLSAVKNYLYEFILQCLTNQHANDEIEATISTQIRFCELLLNKKQFEIALKRIRKIKEQCIAYSQFLPALQAIRVEKKIHSIRDAKGDYMMVMNLWDEIIAYTAKYENQSNYYKLHDQHQHFRRTIIVPRTAAEIGHYKKMLQHPLLQTDNAANSSMSLLFYHAIKGECLTQLDDYRNALKHHQSAVQLCETIQMPIERYITLYSALLVNLGNTFLHLEEIDEALLIVERITNLTKKHPQIASDVYKAIVFANWATLELYVFYYSGRFEEGVSHLESAIEKLQQDYSQYLSTTAQLVINYYAAILYYGSNQPRKAIKKINLIINNDNEYIGHDIVCFAYLLRLIIHIDRGNDDLVISVAKNTITYLEKRQRMFRTEKLFLEFCKKLIRGKPVSKHGLMKEMKEKFYRIRNAESEKSVLQFFDFSAWFTAKSERKQYVEAYQTLRKRK